MYVYIYKRIGYYRVFQCMWICHWLFDQLLVHPISKDPSYPQGPSKLGCDSPRNARLQTVEPIFSALLYIIIQFLRRIAPVAVAAASAAPVELHELNQQKLDDFRKRNGDEAI